MNICNYIMSKEDCLEELNKELLKLVEETNNKLKEHYFVDALELLSKATQIYKIFETYPGIDLCLYKSIGIYISLRDRLCDILSERVSQSNDDIDKAIEEGRKEIRIIPGRIER